MGGVNGFGPGPMRGAFSVGAGAVTVTVSVTVFSGAFASSRAQAALNPTIVRIAAAPAVARRRRVKRSDLILFSLVPLRRWFVPEGASLLAAPHPSSCHRIPPWTLIRARRHARPTLAAGP